MFVLLKVLLFFFRPLVWIVILLIGTAVLKNPKVKKRCFVAGLALLLFFSNPFIVTTLQRAYEAKPVPLAQAPYGESKIRCRTPLIPKRSLIPFTCCSFFADFLGPAPAPRQTRIRPLGT